MNSLRGYLLDGIPVHLRDPVRLSQQAGRVRALLLDEGLTDRARVSKILESLRGDEHLERDTFVWLETVLRGHYGIEYAAADLTEDEQARFWETVAGQFPEDAELRLVHADALLLAGEKERALDLFNRSFEQSPTLISEVGGEVGETMQEAGGKPWLRYRLAMLRGAVEEDDGELVEELTAELRAEFAGEAKVLAEIERARRPCA